MTGMRTGKSSLYLRLISCAGADATVPQGLSTNDLGQRKLTGLSVTLSLGTAAAYL